MIRITDVSDMTSAVYPGRKALNGIKQNYQGLSSYSPSLMGLLVHPFVLKTLA